MAVKIRLMRLGKKRSAFYRVVVMDGRQPRDGRFIEQIGRYDPNQEPSVVEIDNSRAVDWLKKGAQPTEPVVKLLEISGAMSEYKVATGKIHTVVGTGKPKVVPPTAHVVVPIPEPTSEEVETEATEAEKEALEGESAEVEAENGAAAPEEE